MSRIKRFFTEHKLLLALLGVQILLHYSWFLDYGIRTHGDWSFHFAEAMSSLRFEYFSLWLSDYSFGRVLVDIGQAPTYALYGALAKYLGMSYAFSERLIHLWPAALLPSISAYFLILELFKDKRAALIGAIVYSSNTYILILQTGHLTLAGAYALAPLVVLAYIKLLDTRKAIYVVVTALLLAACGAYEPRAAYIVLLILFFYAAFFVSIAVHKNAPKNQVIKSCLFAVAPVLIYVALNFYWMLGLSKVENALDGSILSRGLFGNAFFNTLYSFTLFHPYWNFSEPIAFELNKIPFYFWLIPALAFGGMYVKRQSYKVVFFGLLSLLGVLLTKQVDEPFSGLYNWLFGHIPGFSAFREASKFYLITALGYSVLIAALSVHFIKNPPVKQLKKKYMFPVMLLIIITIFAPNYLPIINGKINTTFSHRAVPNDYTVLRNFILEQPDFFRIYWTPRESRWSVQTALHPRVESTTINESSWKEFSSEDTRQSRASQLLEPLNKAYSNQLLDQSSIKYVIVPLRDLENDDDFFRHYGHDRQDYINQLNQLDYLKRIDIGTKDLAIYENADYQPFVTALDKVSSISSIDNIENAYSFQSLQLKDEKMNFGSNLPTAIPHRKILQLYENINAGSIDSKRHLSQSVDTSGLKSDIYIKNNSATLSYIVKDKAVVFSELVDDSFYQNARQLVRPLAQQTTLAFSQLDDNAKYVISSGEEILPLARTPNHNRVIGTPDDNVSLWKLNDNNLVKNGSLESGLWKEAVLDCNNYDGNAAISMSRSNAEYSAGKFSLRLSSVSHTACTGPESISVTPLSKYLINFDYKVVSGRQAEYEIKFNDNQQKSITEDLITVGEQWETLSRLITVPEGATTLSIIVKARPDDKNQARPVVYYDNFKLSEVNLIKVVRDASSKQYAKVSLADPPTKFNYTKTGLNYRNLVTNGSLENGLWQKSVSDCNTYDDKPEIAMRLNEEDASNGKNSLQLEARRHTACTGPNVIPVKENSSYLLSFDFQSPTSEDGGYNVSFSGAPQAVINKRLPVLGGKWQNYSTIIKVPFGADKINLSFYAYSGSTGKKMITRYDSVQLIEIPAVESNFYVVSESAAALAKPKSVNSDRVSQTSSKITVKGASKPFFISISENYHPQWQLQLDNHKVSGTAKLKPDAGADKVDDNNHFKLNNFMNAWYVDPAVICNGLKEGCVQTADGSYDIELVAEFLPQRWLNVGMLISGATLLACLGYVVYFLQKNARNKNIWKGRVSRTP